MLRTGITAVALAAAASVLSVPTAAQAADCGVNRAEYRKVRPGMSAGKVHRIFDINGSQMYSGYGYQQREYRTCTSRYGFVFVDYVRRNGRWKVDSKAVYWG